MGMERRSCYEEESGEYAAESELKCDMTFYLLCVQ